VPSLRIIGGTPLVGTTDLAADRRIAHRALLLCALSEGECSIAARIAGRELLATVGALREMGIEIAIEADRTRVHGRGLHGLAMPTGALDCGASRETLALLTGVLSGQSFGTRLLFAGPGHGALDHMLGALRARGAHVAASGSADEALRPPLSFAPLLPEEALRGIECELPQPDAHAKSAILISGLFAAGATAVAEPLLSSDHTERMLAAFGVPMRRLGSMAGFDPGAWERRLPAVDRLELPGDTDIAAYISVAASVLPGSHVALRNVGWNPTRTGCFDAIRLLGGTLLAVAKGDRAGHEPIAEIQVRGSKPRGGAMGGEIAFRCGSSLPALCVLGACSARGVEILDGEAFAPPADPIWAELAALARSFGAPASAHEGGLSIGMAPELRGSSVDTRHDPRLIWPAVLFGLASKGETVVHEADDWIDDGDETLDALRRLGARIEVSS
jgi:3-phosphoshikimate 1-carboxyvinyltransferase